METEKNVIDCKIKVLLLSFLAPFSNLDALKDRERETQTDKRQTERKTDIGTDRGRDPCYLVG